MACLSRVHGSRPEFLNCSHRARKSCPVVYGSLLEAFHTSNDSTVSIMCRQCRYRHVKAGIDRSFVRFN